MKTAIYIRVSTEEQAKEGYSIEAQQKKLTDYVGIQGWELFNIYIDDGYSAKDLERPQVQKMIKDIKAKKIRCSLSLPFGSTCSFGIRFTRVTSVVR